MTVQKMTRNEIVPDATLDAKGFRCPLPILKAKNIIEGLGAGQVLEILGTDPVSRHDLAGWCNHSGHTFLGVEEKDDFFKFYVQKKNSNL